MYLPFILIDNADLRETTARDLIDEHEADLPAFPQGNYFKLRTSSDITGLQNTCFCMFNMSTFPAYTGSLMRNIKAESLSLLDGRGLCLEYILPSTNYILTVS